MALSSNAQFLHFFFFLPYIKHIFQLDLIFPAAIPRDLFSVQNTPDFCSSPLFFSLLVTKRVTSVIPGGDARICQQQAYLDKVSAQHLAGVGMDPSDIQEHTSIESKMQCNSPQLYSCIFCTCTYTVPACLSVRPATGAGGYYARGNKRPAGEKDREGVGEILTGE